MILNIVTNEPDCIEQSLNANLSNDWKITSLGEIAKGIYEYFLEPKNDDKVLSVETLLEIGVEPWDIRIR